MKRFLSLLLTAMMIFSCMSFAASAEETATESSTPAFGLYGTTADATNPSAAVGTKVLLTVPADGAVYYNNGTQIATTAGLVDGTVAATVEAGVNKFTAVAGGNTYGPVTLYGFKPVYNGIGANIGKDAGTSSIVKSGTLVEANPEGIANLIVEGEHPFAYLVPETDTVVSHKFSTGMSSRTYLAVGMGFYVNGVLADAVYEEGAEGEEPVEVTPDETFKIYSGQKGNGTHISIYVGPQNHLYVRGYKDGAVESGIGTDTGVVITPNVWHDLHMTINWNADGIANIYIDNILVAKVNSRRGDMSTNASNLNTYYSYPAYGGNGKAYIGNAVTGNVFAQFPVVTNASAGTTSAIAITRNDIINYPTVTLTKEDGDNTVSYTANIPAELEGSVAKILVNGAPAETMANGDKLVILSDTAITGATVTAVIVDAQGNVLTGLKGEPLTSTPVTMDIKVQGVEPLLGDVTLYEVAGAGFETRPYAVAGSKVIVVPPTVVNFNESTQHIAYFSGETDVTASTVAGPFENTVAVPVVAGSTYLTAKVLDTATGAVLSETNQIPLRAQSLSEGTVIDAVSTKASNFEDVTAALTADLESTDETVKAKAEALLAGDRTVYQTKATAANTSARMKSFVTKAGKEGTTLTTDEYADMMEIAFDFYLDPAFETSDTKDYVSIFGFNLAPNSQLGSSSERRMGTYYRVKNEDMHLYVGDADTGIEIETGKWYNVKYYVDARSNRVDYYLDGVLISKAGVQGSATYDLDEYVFCPLAPYSYKGSTAGGCNEVAYFSNATFNAARTYSYAPTISAVADDEANTLTLTLKDLDPTEVSAYLFLNGVKFPQAIPFTGDTYVLEGLTGYADVYVAILAEDGTTATGLFAEELKTSTYSFTDATTTDVITNGMITDTGAVFGLLKRNIPAQYQTLPVSIITINDAGEIAVTPYTFGETEDYKLFNIEGEGIQKVFVWNLAGLKSFDEAITK